MSQCSIQYERPYVHETGGSRIRELPRGSKEWGKKATVGGVGYIDAVPRVVPRVASRTVVRILFTRQPCRRGIVGDTFLRVPTRCRHGLGVPGIRGVSTRFARLVTGPPGIDCQSNRCFIFSNRRAVIAHQTVGNKRSLPVVYGICRKLARRRRTVLFSQRANISAPLATNTRLHTTLINGSPRSLTFIGTARDANLRLNLSDCHTP